MLGLGPKFSDFANKKLFSAFRLQEKKIPLHSNVSREGSLQRKLTILKGSINGFWFSISSKTSANTGFGAIFSSSNMLAKVIISSVYHRLTIDKNYWQIANQNIFP